MGKLGRLGLKPAQRYERARPREVIHIDVKKLGRIVGGAGKRVWGGNSHYSGSFTTRPVMFGARLAGSTCTSRSTTPPAWLTPRFSPTKGDRRRRVSKHAITFFERHGVRVERVLTDNGSP